ncbi:MAG: HAD-IIB family hydrolase [Mycobacterium leprae]
MSKLLAFDLDGTLVDHESRVPERHRAAIDRARAAGHEIILVTGRSWRGAEPVYRELGLTGPAICYLGALVVADGTGRILHHQPLAAQAWDSLKQLALVRGLAVTACVGPDQAVVEGELPGKDLMAFDTAYATCAADDFAAWAQWNWYVQMTPDLSLCAGAPTMAAVYGERAVHTVLEAFPDGLPDTQFDLTDRVKEETVLHVWHRRVDKGQALAEYCRARGIARADVIAFGDAVMDASMIQYAGLGVAMPWGDPRLQAVADLVAAPDAVIADLLDE